MTRSTNPPKDASSRPEVTSLANGPTAPATTPSSPNSVDALMQQMSLLPGLPMARETPQSKVWADDDPNRPETEEDGFRAGALRIAKYRYQAQQQRALAAAAKLQPPEPDPEK